MTPLEAIQYLHNLIEKHARLDGEERDRARQAAQIVAVALTPQSPPTTLPDVEVAGISPEGGVETPEPLPNGDKPKRTRAKQGAEAP
jgi:hypothetical protein